MAVVGGVCHLALALKAELRSERTYVHVLELPLLPMFSEGRRESAMRINIMFKKHSAEVGFRVHGWSWDRLLDNNGMVRSRWLISRCDVHLNAAGYEVFAQYLRSIILQG